MHLSVFNTRLSDFQSPVLYAAALPASLTTAPRLMSFQVGSVPLPLANSMIS
jgi:hypothetical protein